MKINSDTLMPYLLYDKPIHYGNITLYPITMEKYLEFQLLSQSITVRKNSVFRNKKIIKMTYLNFLRYTFNNTELETEYKILGLSQYYFYAIELLKMVCRCEEEDIKFDQDGYFYINGTFVTSEIFEDLRRIIIIQNGIDFDVDEFLNYDTEQALLKAQEKLNKDQDKVGIEDYIDSLVIALSITEQDVMNMSIRKFWRYIKRYQIHETYTISKVGECSGMVTFKEPIRHWMLSLEKEDKYKNLKTNEDELRSKVG